MTLKMTIARKGLILVSVPLILQFIFVLVLSLLLHYSQEDAARLSQSRTFVTKVDSINRDFLDLGLALAAFRYTRVHKFMTQYDHINASLPAKFDELKKLSEGYPARLAHIEKLQKYGTNVIEMTQSFRRPSDSAIVYLMDPIAYRQKVSDAFAQFSAESIAIDNEEIELQQGSPASEAMMRKWLTVCIAFGLLSSTLLTVILTRFFMTNITRRLAVLTANSALFSQKKPLISPVKGDDEIADLDQNFRKMVDQIQEAENRKQLYVKMISHDLRGPITSMRGTFEAATKGIYGEITEKGKSRFSAAVSDSERLIDLIGEMIDYDGLADGSIELEREQFAAEELMIAAKDSLESLAEGKQVELQFSSAEALLNADRERLKRVLINLIHNAIKFSPAHAVVKAEAKLEHDTVVFRIIDQGPGIKQSEIDRLFEPFQMGESAKTTADKGSGLGLAICKMIVEAHDGNIGVESKSGKGSCFWFKVPGSVPSVNGNS